MMPVVYPRGCPLVYPGLGIGDRRAFDPRAPPQNGAGCEAADIATDGKGA